MTELAIFCLGAVLGAAMVLLIGAVYNFVDYHRDRRMPSKHIWEIAKRGRRAGCDG